jgi:alkylation response protein AidB-like acyl-CoA dehydrogenase
MSKTFNRRDLDFLLYEFLDLEGLLAQPRYAEYDRETLDAMLDTAEKIAAEQFLPCAADLDANEPSFDGHKVSIIPQVKAALDAYVEAGFPAASFDYEAAGAMFYSANISIGAYPLLTTGVSNLLCAYGSPKQKELFLPPLLQGRFFGTMCLSEPQAGSSVADIRTKATPTDAGNYLISGTKMWISGGEHDLCENIIHMVLAKIPGGPPGVKGISLFLVPKLRLGDDGALSESNNVVLAGLNHKMGYRGTVNTLLNFGEGGECHGYLIGEPHKGLQYMFHMMNEARIAVGMGAAALGYAGFLYALDYAKERPQGRRLRDKNPELPPVPIIEHPDIKRLLLTQKCYVEGALAMLLYCAYLIDEQKTTDDPARRQEIALLLEILTPIAKSWPAEFCLEANKHAIQVLGGYGYTRDYPVERLYRDNRLNAIHEGTHGIHGLDLLGRKVRIADGACFTALCTIMRADINAAASVVSLEKYAADLAASLDELENTTRIIIECDELERALANATIYLDTMGHIVIAWTWLKQALCATRHLSNAPDEDPDFYHGKLKACRYFFTYELPKTRTYMNLLQKLDDTCLTMTGEQF